MLLVGHENFGPGIACGSELADVSNDADNFHGSKRIEAAKNQVTQRIFARERLFDERLIDHGSERSVEGIALVEIPAGLKRDSERREGAGRNQGEYRLRSV